MKKSTFTQIFSLMEFIDKKFNPKELGFRIKKAREEKSMNQPELASQMDISSRTLINIEAGKSDVSVRHLFRIAELLGTSINTLMDIPEPSITNSFNNIQENASVNGNSFYNIGANSMTHVQIDREWMRENYQRFVFLETIITELKEENKVLKKDATSQE
jgi:transcriptional regulator with XRE-family HTH domain